MGAEMTPEIRTILGTGITLAALGIGGFTWRRLMVSDGGGCLVVVDGNSGGGGLPPASTLVTTEPKLSARPGDQRPCR